MHISPKTDLQSPYRNHYMHLAYSIKCGEIETGFAITTFMLYDALVIPI